ncbi:hypothetical protein Apa02nite_067180 [Actinoplanes palleronii]|uniref:Uncharacterized protein n=1 Tax=Actinoplanes palleronii TaxID=113570 RepID=A0ABQ4BIV7_9ACTN|nr:hypothetical protein Apa02nite_067180 [Actinoplanes palleronii]
MPTPPYDSITGTTRAAEALVPAVRSSLYPLAALCQDGGAITGDGQLEFASRHFTAGKANARDRRFGTTSESIDKPMTGDQWCLNRNRGTSPIQTTTHDG